jgi:signal transduction histidine kinase
MRRPHLSERLERLRVGQWLAITIGALLAFAALGIASALLASERLTNSRTLLLDQISPSLGAASALENALIDEETGIRGYALARERRFLEPYDAGVVSERAAYAALASHSPRTGPAVAEDVRAVRAAARSWRASYAEAVLRAPPRAVRLDLAGKALFDGVRRALARLHGGLQAQDSAARSRLDGAASRLDAFLLVAALLIAGSVIAAGLVLRGILTRPLARLQADTHAVARGDFSHELGRGVGAREIVELRGEVDAMRARIAGELDSVQAAHDLLSRQAEELRRSNAELDRFAAVAAHDLQEPLRKVASFCQALALRYEGRLDDRADQYIALAVDGARRMQDLITALHALARVGRERAHACEVPLGDSLASATAALSAQLQESGGEVRAGPLPTVRGDAALLASLFQNLIGNAVKFRGAQPPVVDISCEARDGAWVLAFADNGIGIAPEYAERVFGVFQRLHPREHYEGTGVGLALSRKIVEYHGGRIWLDAERERGARFVVTLPRDRNLEAT